MQKIEDNVDKWVDAHLKGFSFREHQRETICSIIESVVNKTDHAQLVEAPTGSGKSIISIVVSGVLSEFYEKMCYILCSDLYLWQQYADFIVKNKLDYGMLKGQTGNYECSRNHEDMRNSECRMANIPWQTLFSASKSSQRGFKCAAKCPYVLARKKALSSSVVLMTYQLFLYLFNNVDNTAFKSPDVLICDECHNIPEIVQRQCSPVIRESDFKHMKEIYNWAASSSQTLFDNEDYDILREFTTQKKFTNKLNKCFEGFKDESKSVVDNMKLIQEYDSILNMVSKPCEKIEKNVQSLYENGQIAEKSDLKLYKETSFYRNYMCFWHDFLNALETSEGNTFVKNVSTNEEPSVTFNCTKEDTMVWKYLLRHAEFSIMLSATTGGKEAFEENNGIRYTCDKRCKTIVIPSTFDFSRSPIHVVNRYKMTFAEKAISFGPMSDMVYKIMEKHKRESGMIQTGSYDNAKRLWMMAQPYQRSHLLLYENAKEKEEMIQELKRRQGYVLIGPSLNEGVDLPGDLCRYIVIFKVPYPSLGDKLVAEKMKLYPKWYKSKTSNTIIQGIGRGVRTPDDWCVTYVLDGCFTGLYNSTKDQYPPELQKRIKFYR